MFINTPFVLSSTSKSRISILKKLNLKFISLNPKCNEDYHKKNFEKLNLPPKKISLELSKIKAKSINVKNKLIVGSDTIIYFNKKIINKAKNKKEAATTLKKFSGKEHVIISSIAIYYNHKLIWSTSEQTKVKIRKLKHQEISVYLNACNNSIINSVGCYQLEEKGPVIIEGIKGDFFNVMGFPLFSFLKFLKKINLNKLK